MGRGPSIEHEAAIEFLKARFDGWVNAGVEVEDIPERFVEMSGELSGKVHDIFVEAYSLWLRERR